jgi:hypothetical protein
MILERFNAIVFVGDSVTEAIYAAFEVLLDEDPGQPSINKRGLINNIRRNEAGPGGRTQNFCNRKSILLYLQALN